MNTVKPKLLAHLKAEGHAADNDQRAEVERKLEEFSSAVKDGWENLSEAASAKLNDWLK